MGACEEYARRRAKKEDVEVDTLEEWIKLIVDVLKRRIRRLFEALCQHQTRGTWTKLIPLEPYIQFNGFFRIRIAGQP